MTKKYRLKKNLPITLAGTIFYPKENNSSVYKPEKGGWLEEVPEELVTGCPDWFEEVVEPEPERIEVNGIGAVGFSDHGNWYKFHIASNPGKPWPSISEEHFPAIKAAIEDVLNCTTHICKHCNAEVDTPDEDCYKVLSKGKDTPSRDWEITAYSGNGIFNIGDSMFEYAERAYAENMGVCIHSVRRLSDNTVWTVGEETTSDARYLYKPIKRFFEKEGVMYAQFDEGYGSNDGCLGLNALEKLPPNPQPLFPVTPEDMCNICGGKTVYIRGRYPKDEKRKVCPTCAVERLENINEISSKEYMQTSQSA